MPHGGQHLAPMLPLQGVGGVWCSELLREVAGELIQNTPKTVSLEVARECIRVKAGRLAEPCDDFLAQPFEVAASRNCSCASSSSWPSSHSGCRSSGRSSPRLPILSPAARCPPPGGTGPRRPRPRPCRRPRLADHARARRLLVLQGPELVQQARPQVRIAGEPRQLAQPPAERRPLLGRLEAPALRLQPPDHLRQRVRFRQHRRQRLGTMAAQVAVGILAVGQHRRSAASARRASPAGPARRRAWRRRARHGRRRGRRSAPRPCATGWRAGARSPPCPEGATAWAMPAWASAITSM